MSRFVASFAGVGFCPWAPGTAGSLAALLVGVLLMQGPTVMLPAAAALATILGLVCVQTAVPDQKADPGWVVIDEVAGQWIALLGLGVLTWWGAVLAFAGFRLLDIWKPGPVGWADRQGGALGIMLDDVLAGAIVAAALFGLRVGGLPL